LQPPRVHSLTMTPKLQVSWRVEERLTLCCRRMERFFAWRGVESVIGDTPDGSTGLSEPDQQYPLVLSNQRLAGVCGACAEVYSLVLNQRYQGLPNTLSSAVLENYQHRRTYIWENPVRAGSSERPELFAWSSVSLGMELNAPPPGLKPYGTRSVNGGVALALQESENVFKALQLYECNRRERC
jgi:hypothetical protein